MNGRETLEHLLSGWVLQLEDSPWIYRFTECLEAKSTEPGAPGLCKEFSPMSAGLDWLLGNEFSIPEGYDLKMFEAYTAMSQGRKVQSSVSDMFEYKMDGETISVLLDDMFVCTIDSFEEEELKAMWRVTG